MQLWSIHAMVRVKEEMKQVPLAFVLMSRRTREDYEGILRFLYEDIMEKEARVQEVVCDFEIAVWRAVRAVIPFAEVKGCGFHWTQCLFRQLKKIGLSSNYRKEKTVSTLCKQVMCLHLLPVGKIENTFYRLQDSVSSITSNRDTKKQLKKWFDYVKNTWITNRNWPIASWCQHYRRIRTNNDVEGWHTRLNVHCGRRQHGKGLPLYIVIVVLAKEAVLVELYEEMLLQNHCSRAKRKTYVALNSKFFSLWEQHQNNSLSTKNLLSQCAQLYTDFNSSKFTKNADDDRLCELEE